MTEQIKYYWPQTTAPAPSSGNLTLSDDLVGDCSWPDSQSSPTPITYTFINDATLERIANALERIANALEEENESMP